MNSAQFMMIAHLITVEMNGLAKTITNFLEQYLCTNCLQARFVDQPYMNESESYKLRIRSLLKSTVLSESADQSNVEHSNEMMKILFRLIEIMDYNKNIADNLRSLKRQELATFKAKFQLNEAHKELIEMTGQLIDFCAHVASMLTKYQTIVEKQNDLKSQMKIKYEKFKFRPRLHLLLLHLLTFVAAGSETSL